MEKFTYRFKVCSSKVTWGTGLLLDEARRLKTEVLRTYGIYTDIEDC